MPLHFGTRKPTFEHMHRNPPLIGSAQAAKVFHVDRATFNRWVKAGKVPVVYELEGKTAARLFDADVIEVLAARYRAERLAQLGIAPSEVSA